MTLLNSVRIELLNKDNYETWRIQMQAILIKNEAWKNVNGQNPKPTPVANNTQNEESIRKWEVEDEKARADIILSIKPSELKQVKDCRTSRELWLKLQTIYQLSGPARKVTLIKQLTYHHMQEREDFREHMSRFFDTVEKLNEKMDFDINLELLSVMLLHSLPPSYSNFRCAIESRDTLPTPEALRTKIIEENEARKHETRESTSSAMLARTSSSKKSTHPNKNNRERKSSPKKQDTSGKEAFKYRCHRCRKIGHIAAECNDQSKGKEDANTADNLVLYADTTEITSTKGSMDDKNANVTAEYAGISETLSTDYHPKRETWCIDSGCTAHMCGTTSAFLDMKKATGKVNLVNKSTISVTDKGPVSVTAIANSRNKNVSLSDTLHIPDLRTNLLSVGKICDRGLKVLFEQDEATVIDNRGKTVLKADRINGGLYYLRTKSPESNANAEWNDGSKTKRSIAELWHRKMGHLNYRDLMRCSREGLVRDITIKDCCEDIHCEICARGKMTKMSLPKRSERRSEILEIIHSDMCGPMRTESAGKSKYFVTFIDDSSKWCEVRSLKRKSDVLQAFKEFKALVENQTGRWIKCLQSDNGTEYRNESFDQFLKEHGIKRRLTVPYTPKQNGVAERKNRTPLDMARCLLIQSSLPTYL